MFFREGEMPVSISTQRIAIYAGVILVAGLSLGYWLTRGPQSTTTSSAPSGKDQPAPPPPPVVDPGKPPAVFIYKPQMSPKVVGLELPIPIQVNDITAPVPVIAKTTATDVRWIVSGNNPKAQPKVVLIPSLKMALVQPTSPADDVIVIFAYTVVDGKPTDPAVTAISVSTKATPPSPDGPTPPTPPEPVQPPAPKPKAAKPTHVTFILDFVKPAPGQSTIRNDTQFRNWLNSVGIEYHELNIKSETLKQPGGLQPYVDEWSGPPVIVAQDDGGNVIGSAKFKDAATTKSFLEGLIAQSK